MPRPRRTDRRRPHVAASAAGVVLAVATACGSSERPSPPDRDQVVAPAAADPWSTRTPPADAGSVAPNACLSDAELARAITTQTRLITAPATAGPPRPVGEATTCAKRVFEYPTTAGTYRIAVWRDEATGSVRSGHGTAGATSAACLEEAARAAERYVPYARRLLADARARVGARWDDIDLGPARHVTCAAPREVSTLLHELVHELASGPCLYVPDGAPLCFERLERLPPRRLATLDAFPREVGSLTAVFAAQRDLYLVQLGDQSVLDLFDELLAYTVTAEVEAARIADRTAPVTTARHVDALSFMAYASLRYLEQLRSTDAAAFADAFGPGTTNRASLSRLLARVEAARATWVRARPRTQPGARQVNAAEDAFWTLYLATRKRVGV